MPDSELLRENESTLGSRAEMQLESLFMEELESWGRGADLEVTPPDSPCNATITRNVVACILSNGLSFDFFYLEP